MANPKNAKAARKESDKRQAAKTATLASKASKANLELVKDKAKLAEHHKTQVERIKNAGQGAPTASKKSVVNTASKAASKKSVVNTASKAASKKSVVPVAVPTFKAEVEMFRIPCGKCSHEETVQALTANMKDKDGIVLTHDEVEAKLTATFKTRFCFFCFQEHHDAKLYDFYVQS